jgi:hypothetical protein
MTHDVPLFPTTGSRYFRHILSSCPTTVGGHNSFCYQNEPKYQTISCLGGICQGTWRQALYPTL